MTFHCMCGIKEVECDYPNCKTGEWNAQKSKPHILQDNSGSPTMDAIDRKLQQADQCLKCGKYKRTGASCPHFNWAIASAEACKRFEESAGKVVTVKAIKPAVTGDGSTASYYELPAGATQLQDLISHRNMNAQLGEVFRTCYRYGLASHSDQLRDAKKIKFYIEAEIARLQKLGGV